MEAFWKGFEKQAVSGKWINQKVISGLANRAAKAKDGAVPQLLKATEISKARFGFAEGAKNHWRQAQSPAVRKAHLDYVGKLNKATKGKPEAAKKGIEQMHAFHNIRKWTDAAK